MDTFYSSLIQSIPPELLPFLKALDGFWSVIRTQIPQKGLGPFAGAGKELVAKMEGAVVKMDPAEFVRLQQSASVWTGFGVNMQNEPPNLALFFRDTSDGILEAFPKKIRDLNPEVVPRVRLRPIRPRVSTKGLAPATRPVSKGTPGLEIDWTGTGCQKDRFGNGTLGAFLQDQTGDIWIVSANHVMSQNGACRTNIVTVPNLGTVSNDVRPVMIGDTGNLADVAVAKWTGGEINPQVAALPPLSATPVAPAAVQNEIVTKAGGTSTTGLVAYIAQKITADPFPPFSDVEFEDQILVRDRTGPFCIDGDSGSIVVFFSNGNSLPVGLVEYSNAESIEHPAELLSAVSPMENVIQVLNYAVGKTFTIMTALPGTDRFVSSRLDPSGQHADQHQQTERGSPTEV